MIAEFDVQMLGDAIEVENMEMVRLFPCASNETHPNFARNLSRDMHLTPTSMTSQIVYDVLISSPDFCSAFSSMCESLTSCNLVLNKAIRLEFGEEDGVDMGIGEFLSSEVFLLLRFSAGVIERMFLLLQYNISSCATATVCTDVYPRPDLNSL